MKSHIKKASDPYNQRISRELSRHFKKSFFKENKRLIYFFIWILAIMIILAILQPFIIKIIKADPDLLATYTFVLNRLEMNSLLWLFIIALLGSLFFITLASDIFYVYYIIRGSDPISTTVVFFIAVMLGRSIDYWIGFVFSNFVTTKVLKDDYHHFNKRFSKIENSILFFGNLIPLFPIEFFIAFLGTTKYPYWKVILYNAAGKVFKLVLIALFIDYLIFHSGILQLKLLSLIRQSFENMFSIG